uniref:Uncharacterized protein n=1 Tax=Rhizophora mucronata TaxID=61149 RepID=A0A2P2QH58_RHIMU
MSTHTHARARNYVQSYLFIYLLSYFTCRHNNICCSLSSHLY